jgi:hypothetical protein
MRYGERIVRGDTGRVLPVTTLRNRHYYPVELGLRRYFTRSC